MTGASKSLGGFGSLTWANEPPSEEEQFKVKQERSLFRAVYSGDCVQIKSLLEGNRLIANCEGSGRSRPLHISAARGDIAACQLLIAHGADLNATNSLGFTPLFTAAANGMGDCVQWLQGQGADIRKISKKGQSARDVARSFGHPEVERLIRV